MTTSYSAADGLVRVYPADASGDAPGSGLVWAHGGGFAAGDLDMPEADWVARSLAARGVTVVSVDYRLVGDGCRYPAPSDDVLAAWRWTLDHAAELGIDPARLAIGGASAGANLATGAVLRLERVEERPTQEDASRNRERNVERVEERPTQEDASRNRERNVERVEERPTQEDASRNPPPRARFRDGAGAPPQPAEFPAGVFLAYPTLLAVQPAPDAALRALLDANPAADRFTPAAVLAMYENYLGGPVEDAPLPVVPGRAAASDLVGFPPVLMINSEADELRVSGEVFAATLVEAGVPLELVVEPGTEHGHLNRPDEPAASDSIERVARWIATLTTLRTTEGIPS